MGRGARGRARAADPAHDASNVAAVIVEPIAGSTGVLVPPQGYLERLRQICDRHGVLLIFDEVITAFGRTGNAFASQTFGVTPDLITCAKALTNAAVPMGAVIVKREIYEAFLQGPEDAIELYHGYTYSGHPLAAAAAVATLDLLRGRAAVRARRRDGAVSRGSGALARRARRTSSTCGTSAWSARSSSSHSPASRARGRSRCSCVVTRRACSYARPATRSRSHPH